MSVQREELLRLVEELPEDEVPVVLDDVRRHLSAVRGRPWPPAWFGAGESRTTDRSLTVGRDQGTFTPERAADLARVMGGATTRPKPIRRG